MFVVIIVVVVVIVIVIVVIVIVIVVIFQAKLGPNADERKPSSAKLVNCELAVLPLTQFPQPGPT